MMRNLLHLSTDFILGRDSAILGEDQAELRQIKEMLMLPLAGNLVQCQKTGRIPPVQRRLSDQFLRQIKEKVMCFQA